MRSESPVLLYFLQLNTQTYFKNIWWAADTLPHTHPSRMQAGRCWKNLYGFLSGELHKLFYRNWWIMNSTWTCLKRKPTMQPNPTQPAFVKRAYGTFGEPGLVFTEPGEPCPGLDLMSHSFMHLWFKFLESGSSQLWPSCSWTHGRGQFPQPCPFPAEMQPWTAPTKDDALDTQKVGLLGPPREILVHWGRKLWIGSLFLLRNEKLPDRQSWNETSPPLAWNITTPGINQGSRGSWFKVK